jgi:hypothetical protein
MEFLRTNLAKSLVLNTRIDSGLGLSITLSVIDETRASFDDAAFAVGDEVGEVGYVFPCVAGGDGFADDG